MFDLIPIFKDLFSKQDVQKSLVEYTLVFALEVMYLFNVNEIIEKYCLCMLSLIKAKPNNRPRTNSSFQNQKQTPLTKLWACNIELTRKKLTKHYFKKFPPVLTYVVLCNTPVIAQSNLRLFSTELH